jgi:hypothetical protein
MSSVLCLCKNLHKSDMWFGFCVCEWGEWDWGWGWKDRLLRNVYLTYLVQFTFVSKNKTYIWNKRQFEFLPYKLQVSCMYGIFKESMCKWYSLTVSCLNKTKVSFWYGKTSWYPFWLLSKNISLGSVLHNVGVSCCLHVMRSFTNIKTLSCSWNIFFCRYLCFNTGIPLLLWYLLWWYTRAVMFVIYARVEDLPAG